jgi:hypothetical protein
LTSRAAQTRWVPRPSRFLRRAGTTNDCSGAVWHSSIPRAALRNTGSDPGWLLAQGGGLETGPHLGQPVANRRVGRRHSDAQAASGTSASLRSRHSVVRRPAHAGHDPVLVQNSVLTALQSRFLPRSAGGPCDSFLASCQETILLLHEEDPFLSWQFRLAGAHPRAVVDSTCREPNFRPSAG